MHVVVGLSGGVDSAVTALLLREAGHRVSGVFMVNWIADEAGYCNAAEDFSSARAVADELDIPLQRVDFSDAYHQRVFADFLDQYRRGRTPNPDVLCNREIKFAPFLEHARRLGADAVATGHYARLRHDAEGPHLLRAADADKDQTYFLAAVTAAALRDVMFPLGDLHKQEVRDIARRAGLPNHRRKDSTGICFIGERHMRDFLRQYLPGKPGDIVTTDGRKVGRHPGVAFFTPGQRRGLAIGGVAGAAEAPWYVVDRDLAENRLIVDQNPQHPLLMHSRMRTLPPHWLHDPLRQATQISLQARIRHRQPLQPCSVSLQSDGGLEVQFESPQRAAAAGQFIAFYLGDECVGCAELDAVIAVQDEDRH